MRRGLSPPPDWLRWSTPPYLAHALFSSQPVAAVGLGTFAVDRGWRLYVDPATLLGWGPALAGGVLVHEIGHLVRAHAERADALGADYDHQRWNLATETVRSASGTSSATCTRATRSASFTVRSPKTTTERHERSPDSAILQPV